MGSLEGQEGALGQERQRQSRSSEGAGDELRGGGMGWGGSSGNGKSPK